MIEFARLYAALDGTNATSAKVEAMARYFAQAPAADAAWAVFFLTGRRLLRLLPHLRRHAFAQQPLGQVADHRCQLVHRSPNPRAMIPRSTSRVPPRREKQGANCSRRACTRPASLPPRSFV